MKVKVYDDRKVHVYKHVGTQNENNVTELQIEVPEKYQDFNKKIVFVTKEKVFWDIIENDTYMLTKTITKYGSIKFYIWLTKDEQDFRSEEKEIIFNCNTDANEEIVEEEIDGINKVLKILDDEVVKVTDLEKQVTDLINNIQNKLENGEFNGKNGANGQDGANGLDGQNGVDGQDGYTPQKGTDYWTATDKEEIIADLKENSNFVQDESYVHTDNNFTSEEKEKLSNLENYDDAVIREDIISNTNKISKINTRVKTWKKIRTIIVPSDESKGQTINGVRYSFSGENGIKGVSFSTDSDGNNLKGHHITAVAIKLSPSEKVNINQGFLGLTDLSGTTYSVMYFTGPKQSTALRYYIANVQGDFLASGLNNPHSYTYNLTNIDEICGINFFGHEATSILGEGTKLEIKAYGYWDEEVSV